MCAYIFFIFKRPLKDILSDCLLNRLAEESLLEYTIQCDARNNVTNIGRDLNSKLTDWISKEDPKLAKHGMKELRWVTMGRHHNWLETTPGTEKTAGRIPTLLNKIGEELSKLLNFPHLIKTEASIINYYPANYSTIGIHRDDIGSTTTV